MATIFTKPETLFGKRVRRQEDPRLITGTALYLDDLKMPGMHHAIVVRSPYGAANIKGIDTKAALATAGVVAVFTGEDVKHLGPVPCAASLPGLRVPHHHLLAQDRVYYVGHPVAVVVATDRNIARDAADLVEVEYEELRAVADPEKAMAEGAPAVHPEWPDNVAFTFHQEGGDTDQAFRDAEVTVRQRITSQRLIPTAMETRGVVAEWRAGERSLTLHSSTQIPHLLRTLVAGILGMAENLLRVITRPKPVAPVRNGHTRADGHIGDAIEGDGLREGGRTAGNGLERDGGRGGAPGRRRGIDGYWGSMEQKTGLRSRECCRREGVEAALAA